MKPVSMQNNLLLNDKDMERIKHYRIVEPGLSFSNESSDALSSNKSCFKNPLSSVKNSNSVLGGSQSQARGTVKILNKGNLSYSSGKDDSL